MSKQAIMKRLLLILTALSLVLALMPAAALAQEGEGEAGEDQVEQVEGEAATEEGDHSEGEGEEEGGLLTPLGINTGLLIAQVVNFLLIAGLLGAFMWKPAVNMLDERSAKIQKGLEDAAAAAKARQNAEAEADKILAEARSERQQVLEEARQQADDVRKQIESEAREEAERIRTEAQEDARTARDAELADLRSQVLQISTAVAGRILDEKIDADTQSELVSNFFTKLPDSAKSLTGEVEVVSAMPLTDDEKSKVESEIGADSFVYTVEPEILGGLILRSQDKVVDGSVRTSLNELTERLS